MYAKPVVIYQGIDNPLQVRVKNQEQVAVNMVPYLLQAEIQDPDSFLTVESFGIQFHNVSKGIGSFVIPKVLVNKLEQRRYKLTFKFINKSSNQEQPAYVDHNYMAPTDLVVLPGYYSTMPPDAEEIDDFLKIDGGTI
jgi:hypothetical protein